MSAATSSSPPGSLEGRNNGHHHENNNHNSDSHLQHPLPSFSRDSNGSPPSMVLLSETSEEVRARTWKEAWIKAGDRGEDECPICMCSMEPVSAGNGDGNGDGDNEGGSNRNVSAGERRRQRRQRCQRRGDGGKQRDRLLLSCSHVFHKAVSQREGCMCMVRQGHGGMGRDWGGMGGGIFILLIWPLVATYPTFFARRWEGWELCLCGG